jgi:hypothetical protein
MIRLGFLALMLGVALFRPAQAAPVPAGTVVTAPDWVAGSEWYYSDGYALKVTSLSPQGVVFDRLDAPGQWFSRQGFIRKDSATGTTTRNAIYRTIPDAAGLSLTAGTPLTFQREYLSNGKLVVHASSWAVEGRETITVPAGTFDCWVIVWRTRSLRSDWTGFERWWYSPAAQNYVRMEFKYGQSPDGSRVLMRYRLGPDPAAAASTAPVPAAAVAPPAPKPVNLVPAPEPVPAPKPVAVVAAPLPAAKPADPVAAAPPTPIAPQPVAVTPPRAAPLPAVPVAEPKAAAVPKQEEEPVKPARAEKAPTRAQEAKAEKDSAKPEGPRSDGKSGAWHAQVGSSKDASAMRVSLDKTLSDNPSLHGLPSGIAAHDVAGRGTFYRAWLGSYDSSRDAQALCASLKTHGPGCAVFKRAIVEAKAD